VTLNTSLLGAIYYASNPNPNPNPNPNNSKDMIGDNLINKSRDPNHVN